MSGSNYYKSTGNYGYNKVGQDERLGIRHHFTDRQQIHLPDTAKLTSSPYTYDDVDSTIGNLRSKLKASRHYVYTVDEDLKEDKSKVYTHNHDTYRTETNNTEHHKNLGLHSNTLTNKHRENTHDFATNGSYIGETSAAQFYATSNSLKSETIENPKSKAYTNETRRRGNSAKLLEEVNGYGNSGADTYDKGTKTSSSQTRGDSIKYYQDRDLNDFENEGKFKRKTQCAYYKEAPSTEPHIKYSYTLDDRGLERQIQNSPECDSNNSKLNIMDNTCSLYKPKNNITFENQSHISPFDSETSERQHIEGKERDVRKSTISKTYSRIREKPPLQITDNEIYDRHVGHTENRYSSYRCRNNETQSSTRDYREELRENGKLKETVVDRLGHVTDTYRSDKERDREIEKLKQLDRLKLEIQDKERSEKLRENGQQKKKVVDRLLIDNYNSNKQRDREIEKVKQMNDRLKFEKQETERSGTSRENGQRQKTAGDRPATDACNSDKQNDREMEKFHERNEHKMQLGKRETERREKLREYEQHKEMVADRPASCTYNSDQQKDREIEKLKTMFEHLRSEKQKTEESHKEKDRELEKLKKMHEHLKLEKQQTERRSNEITQQLSRQMKHSNHFENCNGDCSSSRVADKFRLLYDRKWVELSKWISEEFQMIPEIKIIQYLSHLIKSCYKECTYMADNQIRQFLFLGDKDAIPKHGEHPELFELRKQYTQSDVTRKQVRKIVKDKIQIADSVSILKLEVIDHSLKEKVERFLDEFIDACCLVTISEPAISLNFDVVGKMYSDCADHFSVYSLKRPVDDPTRTEGTVYEVVWPCVQLKLTSEVYKKGDVILIKKMKKNTTEDKCTQTKNTLS